MSDTKIIYFTSDYCKLLYSTIIRLQSLILDYLCVHWFNWIWYLYVAMSSRGLVSKTDIKKNMQCKEYIILNIYYVELHTWVKSEMAINDIQILLFNRSTEHNNIASLDSSNTICTNVDIVKI